MALPYEAKKRLLLVEFETGRELIENTRLIVSRSCDFLSGLLSLALGV